MAATVQLDKGTTYRGRAIVFYPSIVVTRSKVKEELEKNGFSNVTVWMDEDELPSSWPASARKDVSSTGFVSVQNYYQPNGVGGINTNNNTDVVAIGINVTVPATSYAAGSTDITVNTTTTVH